MGFEDWRSDFFTYENGKLHCEGVPAEKLAAEYGTPLYVYSAGEFRARFRDVAQGFAELNPLVCYAVKACSTLGVLKLLKAEGAGFDCVSMGEIERCLRVGADPKRIVFAGVGKTREEIVFAIERKILMFNVESLNELRLIAEVAAEMGVVAPVALRLNPDVDPRTHAYISTGQKESKFGIDLARAEEGLDLIAATPSLDLRGIHFHIGSQITDSTRHREAVTRALPFLEQVAKRGLKPEFLNVGGGFGISYVGTEGLPLADFAREIVPLVKQTGLRLLTEPGRYIAGNAGILVTRVIYTKQGSAKEYAVVDAAMNDLLRPSIYQAFHGIWPVGQAPRALAEGEGLVMDVVGPVCESGDFLAKDRRLPALQQGELLAVFSAGAYGFTMASNYNTRPRAAEILVDAGKVTVIRDRETVDGLLALEMAAIA